MPRRPALVTQADVARAIRAAQATGLVVMRIVARPDGIAIETGAAPSSLTQREPAPKPQEPVEPKEDFVL